MNQVYLGDGAFLKEGSYAGEFVVFTTDGIEITNTVVLGPAEAQLLARSITLELDTLKHRQLCEDCKELHDDRVICPTRRARRARQRDDALSQPEDLDE